ncbi:MAG: tetratricopeptide repeat protein [Oscillatoriales cyanobacterium RM2_1_1]|nr:tetratricopeptide repeat protein [Oscillatoriales cyanobacterium RM2_1_1]
MKFRTPIQVNWKTALKRAGISCLFVLIIAGIASPNSALESNLNCPTESLTSSFSLCQAPPIAQNSTQNSQEIQAQQLYQQGKFQESRLLLDQAITTYKAQGDRPGTARALRNLGLVYLKTQNWSDAQEAISQALVLLAELPNSKTIQHLQGSTLEAQGQLYLLTNRPEQALETWKTTATTYQEIQDWTGWVRSQINQSQALQTLGLYTQALKKLVAAQTQLAQEPDSILKAKALQSLGDVLRGVGRLDGAQAALEQSLILANQLQDPEQSAVTLISLGNTFRQKNQIDQSLESYREAVQATDSPELKLQAQLNQLSLFIQNQQVQPALDLLPAIEALLDQLSPSTSKVQSQINLAQSLIDARNLETSPEIRQNPKISKLQIANYLTAAIQLAETLNDSRSQAYALGLLGNLYESNQQFNEAQQLTEKALILAQGINATDIAYRWQWQLGRIATAKQDRKTAISAYTQAVNNLKSLRSDIVAISSTVQFGFREQVEPVYRELVGLLLAGEPTQDDLKKARDVLESLQVAELDNFFRDACLDTRPVNIEEIDPLAAIFYTILLPDYLAVIVTLPDQSLNYHRIDLSRAEIEMGLQKLTEAITIPRERVFIENFLEPSQQVYQWLVGSFAEILTANTIQTLVFVLDSQMRNIPVASLYDGENYLMEKYNVAIAPAYN